MLKSWVVHQLAYNIFITNNESSFLLRLKENLIKYQIVFKHYDHDCTLLSKNIPKCFWVIDWITMLLLKINGGWAHLWILQKKRTFMILLIGVWIKTNFQLKSTSFILFKSSFRFFADKPLLCITEELDVCQAV